MPQKPPIRIEPQISAPEPSRVVNGTRAMLVLSLLLGCNHGSNSSASDGHSSSQAETATTDLSDTTHGASTAMASEGGVSEGVTMGTTPTTFDTGGISDTDGQPITGTTTLTSSGTSSETLCGNGLLDTGEQCDLGSKNGDDAPCSTECKADKIIFVSSEDEPFSPYPSTALAGVQADMRCQQHAEAGKKDGSLPLNDHVYRAWISTAELPAKNRITPGGHRYVNTNGEVVAMNWNDLINGELISPIAYNELGFGPYDAYVWTGTREGGVAGVHCQDWTAFDEKSKGTIGRTIALDSGWTDLIKDEKNPAPCMLHFPIYCVEDGTL